MFYYSTKSYVQKFTLKATSNEIGLVKIIFKKAVCFCVWLTIENIAQIAKQLRWSGSWAELGNASVILLRNPSSNLGKDRNFCSICLFKI
jgi:hypothetical protein